VTVNTQRPLPIGVMTSAGGSRLGFMFVALGGLVLFGYGLYIAAWFVNVLVLTLLLALVMSPILFGLRRRGWPAWLAVTGAILVVGVISLAFVGLAWLSLSQFDENLPAYQARLNQILTDLSTRFDVTIPAAGDLAALRSQLGEQLLRGLIPVALNLASLLAFLVMYMFLLLYAFGEVFVMPARLRNLTGGDPVLLAQFTRFGRDMRSFFALNAGVGAIAAVIDTVVLLGIGVDFALFWGLVSFVMSFIPNIGFIISMLAPALLALIQYGPREAVEVIVAYCIINMAIDYVLRPRIIGQDLDQSQIVTFLAVIGWGALLGPTGALLSVPLTLIAKLMLEIATGTRRYSALIVEEIPTETNGTSSEGVVVAESVPAPTQG